MVLKGRQSGGGCSRPRLSAFLDGELSPAEQLQTRRHLATCARCREILEEYRAIASAIQAGPEERLPVEVRRRLNRRLQDERRPRLLPRRSRWQSAGTAATVAAAAVALAIGAGGLRPLLGGGGPPGLGTGAIQRPAESVALNQAPTETRSPDREPATAARVPSAGPTQLAPIASAPHRFAATPAVPESPAGPSSADQTTPGDSIGPVDDALPGGESTGARLPRFGPLLPTTTPAGHPNGSGTSGNTLLPLLNTATPPPATATARAATPAATNPPAAAVATTPSVTPAPAASTPAASPTAPAGPTPRSEATATRTALAVPTAPIEVAAARTEATPIRGEPTRTAPPATPTVMPPTASPARSEPTATIISARPSSTATSGAATATTAPVSVPAGPIAAAAAGDFPTTGPAIRSAAACDLSTPATFTVVLSGDPATGTALGCPLTVARAVTVQTQTMRAGWLIDAGRPGPIYAVFGNWTWRALPARSIGAILATGLSGQLGEAEGSPWSVAGLIQQFEGGTVLAGPEGYIFVLLQDGRARVY